MKGLNKPLIHALKRRKKTLTRTKSLTTAAAINYIIQNEEKSTVSSNHLKTVALGATTTVTDREFQMSHKTIYIEVLTSIYTRKKV